MTAGERALVRWAGETTHAPELVDVLADALLAGARPGSAHSTLNNDGSPLQVCITCGPTRREVRLIGDPTAHVMAQDERTGAAADAMERVLALCGSTALSPVMTSTVAALLPSTVGELFTPGLFWLAAGVRGGAALYINTRWGAGHDRWNDVARWLRDLLPPAGASDRLVSVLRAHSVLVSAGVEGRGPGDGRAKIYWRLREPVPLHELGVFPLAHHSLEAFIADVIGERDVSLAGLVFSAGFSMADGALYDAKLDICAHCVPDGAAAWATVINRCCTRYGLVPSRIGEGLDGRHCEVALVGFGRTVCGVERLNVYLKQFPGSHVSRVSHTIH